MASVPAADLERFQLSLERCLMDESFVSRFYARFLLSSDEVAAKFASTDLARQASMLKRSLYLVARAAYGLEDGLQHLQAIAESHSRRGLDIPPHLYEHWLETLLQVMRETETRYDEELEQVWRSCLQPCIDRMTGAYESR